MGARNIVVANVGPIGCIPYQRDINPSAGENCVAYPNQLAQMYNSQLKDLVAELNTNLEGSKFVYADVYHIVDDIIQNYRSFGVFVYLFFCSLFSFLEYSLLTDFTCYLMLTNSLKWKTVPTIQKHLYYEEKICRSRILLKF